MSTGFTPASFDYDDDCFVYDEHAKCLKDCSGRAVTLESALAHYVRLHVAPLKLFRGLMFRARRALLTTIKGVGKGLSELTQWVLRALYDLQLKRSLKETIESLFGNPSLEPIQPPLTPSSAENLATVKIEDKKQLDLGYVTVPLKIGAVYIVGLMACYAVFWIRTRKGLNKFFPDAVPFAVVSAFCLIILQYVGPWALRYLLGCGLRLNIMGTSPKPRRFLLLYW